jgi:hypothetical protein
VVVVKRHLAAEKGKCTLEQKAGALIESDDGWVDFRPKVYQKWSTANCLHASSQKLRNPAVIKPAEVD